MPESNPSQQLTPTDFHNLCPSSEKERQEVSAHLIGIMSSMDSKDLSAVHKFKDGLLTLGSEQQESFWRTNDRLIHPLQQLMTDTREGGEVARLLKSLHKKVSAIQPPNGNPGWIQRFLLLFSLKESAWDMWLESYPEKKKEVLQLVDKLSSAKKQLKRDNLILTDDQSVLETEMKKLQSAYDWVSGFEIWLKQNSQHTDLENHDLIRQCRLY